MLKTQKRTSHFVKRGVSRVVSLDCAISTKWRRSFEGWLVASAERPARPRAERTGEGVSGSG